MVALGEGGLGRPGVPSSGRRDPTAAIIRRP
jgi:hypothetical protein